MSEESGQMQNKHDIEKVFKTIQERYDLATKAAKVGVWDWNIKEGQFYLDKNVKAILGYSDEEIPNDLDKWFTHVVKEDREAVKEAIDRHLSGETPQYIIEHRMRHKNGSVRWILCRGTATRNGNGEATRIMGTDMDITERKVIETLKDELIMKLEKALDDVKKLSGLLPICSYCKNIRDSNGKWQRLEAYIESHSEADFSHSICPTCMKKHHPDKEPAK
jgi:PAS domain S-box-containing protein